MWSLRIATIFAILLISSVYTIAQSASASLSGWVSDENGAGIPEAKIAVTNIATGVVQNANTNGDGYFAFTLLPSGHYKLLVQHEGFANLEVTEVILAINDQRSIKLQLRVGMINETVVVEGTSIIQSESAAVETLVDRRFVDGLPLNGRSFHSLLALVPGVVLTKSNFSGPLNQGQFSSNGQRSDSNNFTVDGVSANFGISATSDSFGSVPPYNVFGGTSNLVSIEALEELKVKTSTYAPEFGRNAGAQILVLTRSGTNEFHGSVFEYFRDEALDANDWFANSIGFARAPLRHSDFGGVLGGPVIPKKTFFFFSYEGLRLRQPRVIQAPVPSTSLRARVAEPFRVLLNAAPLPNRTDGINLGVFTARVATRSTLNATSLRLDHKISEGFTVFGRFNHSPSEALFRGNPASNVTNSANQTKTFTLGITNSLHRSIQNEIRANYSASGRTSRTFLDDFGGAVVPQDSSLYPSVTTPDLAAFEFSFPGDSFRVGHSASHQRQINLIDNLAVVIKDHQFKFGFDYRKLSPSINSSPYSISVSSDLTRALSGIARGVIISSQLGDVFPIYSNLSVYGQDTWKVEPRLTFTYGLRWDVNPRPREKNGNYPYTVLGWEDPPTMVLGPKATSFGNTLYGNIAPRVGVTYLLVPDSGREMVIRGGFGIFYDLAMSAESTALDGANFPYSTSKVLSEVLWPLNAEQSAPQPFSLDPPYLSMTIFDPKLRSPRTYEWSAALEQSIGTHQVWSASYVGAAGRYLKSNQILGSANFDVFFFPQIYRDWGTSDYHALQVQFERRLSKSLQALVSYTWSHSIDTASDDFDLSDFVEDRRSLGLNRGPSDFDVRHSLSAAVSYDMPRPHGKVINWALRDWSFNTILLTRSATPVDVHYNFANIRPDLVTSVPLYLSDPNSPGGRRINPNAFAAPPDVPFIKPGNLGRNALRAFPVFQLDVSLRRTLKLSEHGRLQIMADFFNILNHPNFGDPQSFLTGDPEFDSLQFGRATSMLGDSMSFGGGLNPIYQIGGARSVQLAVKLQF